MAHNFMLGSWHYIQRIYYDRNNLRDILCDVEIIDVSNPPIYTFSEDGFMNSNFFALASQRRRYFCGGDEQRLSLNIDSSLFGRDYDRYKVIMESDDIIHLYTISKYKTQERHTFRRIKDGK